MSNINTFIFNRIYYIAIILIFCHTTLLAVFNL